MNTSPSTPAKRFSRDEVADAARHKLMTYKMKTNIPPGASPPSLSRPSSGVGTPRSNRHSRGPSLTSPANNTQRHSPPLAAATPPSRPPSLPSSRPQSHHRRNSSLSTRRDSREIMAGGLSLPSSPNANTEHTSGRDDALRALEGRRPLTFVKGFEQVVVPDWKTPDVEAKFEWPAPPKAAQGTAAFGSASLVGKRDSFGKNLVAMASLKDQLQTLLEEEEEEEGAQAGMNDKAAVLPSSPTASTSSPLRQRPTNLRLEPAAPILPQKVVAEQGSTPRLRQLSLAASLPSPALTPSPRLSSLGVEPSSPPLGAAAFTTSPVKNASPSTPSQNVLRPLSLAGATLTASPATPSVASSGQSSILSPQSLTKSSSGSADSTKQMRRTSMMSYRSSQSSSGGGRGSPAFSMSSSAAIEPSAPRMASPATPSQDRALQLQITYMQQENASLLERIAGLERSLALKEKEEEVTEQLRIRVTDLEQQVNLLKSRLQMERNEASSAKEVARRLSERLWKLERKRDAGSANSSNPTSPSLPHSKATSASSPRSMFSGRPTSGASSFWGGSVDNHSVGSMTDVEEPYNPGAVNGDLGVLPEEDENEVPTEPERNDDEDEDTQEDTQEVDPAHQSGIEVTLLPESASSADCASAPSSARSSARDSLSAYSLSSASTSEAEAQSLAVLEGMAAEGDAFLTGDPSESWDGGSQGMEGVVEGDGNSDDSFRSLPNPYTPDEAIQPTATAHAPVLAPFSIPPTPVTPTTPTLRTPTVSSMQASVQQPARASVPMRHAKTPSQAAMMSWKFPSAAPRKAQTLADEEKDRFFATLEEDVSRMALGPIGKPMGQKTRRKKSIMRPYMGDDEFEDLDLSGMPTPVTVTIDSAATPDMSPSRRTGTITSSPSRTRATSPITAPPPTWSMRTPSAPRRSTEPRSTEPAATVPTASRGVPTPPPPVHTASGFSFTKLTSVFSSWVAPQAPPPPVPRITISTPASAQLPSYYAPQENSILPRPRARQATSPARPVTRNAQPQPIPSPLEKLDFRGGGCRHCEGVVIEL